MRTIKATGEKKCKRVNTYGKLDNVLVVRYELITKSRGEYECVECGGSIARGDAYAVERSVSAPGGGNKWVRHRLCASCAIKALSYSEEEEEAFPYYGKNEVEFKLDGPVRCVADVLSSLCLRLPDYTRVRFFSLVERPHEVTVELDRFFRLILERKLILSPIRESPKEVLCKDEVESKPGGVSRRAADILARLYGD